MKPEPREVEEETYDYLNVVEVETWWRSDQKSDMFIILPISPSELKLIKSHNMSHETWRRLK